MLPANGNLPWMVGMIVFLLLTGTVQAQQPYMKSYIPPSPNAASLGMYGQIPVSEYSGVPAIQIPLYSIETDGFSMPVSLSYHAGALRTADEASWVGLGWALNAGGVITRSKRDRDDFAVNGFARTSSDRPCNDGTDQEPDMFYYNIGGKAGKFLITGPWLNFSVRYFTRDNIKIEYLPFLPGWRLTTGEGVVYKFEKREYTSESTVINGEAGETETYVSSWYVTSIELVNGTKINFTYLAPNNTKTVKIITSYNDNVVTSYWPPDANSMCCYSAWGALRSDYNRIVTTVHSDEVILSQIDYPTGSVKLNTSARTDLKVAEGTAEAKKLDNIQVYTKDGASQSLLKTFVLNYDYYYVNSNIVPPKPGSRLRLTHVTEQTPAATFKPYTLQYNSDNLPPPYQGSGSFLGHYALLKSMVYPTGGSAVFIFEPVEYTIPPSTSIQRKGARIKKIYTRDAADSLDVRRFEYEGAKLMSRFGSGVSTPYTVYSTIFDTCCGRVPPIAYTINRSINIDSDLSSLGETVNGHIFGHDKVTTWFGENGENGKKESFFENEPPEDPNYKKLITPTPTFSFYLPVPVPLNTPAKSGLLKEAWEYRNDNGTFVPVRRTVNTYTSADVVTTSARRFAFNRCNDWTYDITTAWVQQTGQDVYTYDMNGAHPVSVSTWFYYDDPGNALPTRIMTQNTRGQVTTINTYVKEKAAQVGGVYTTMHNKHIINTVIDQEKTRNNVSIGKTFTSYKDWYSNGKVLKPEIVQQQKGAENPAIAVRYGGYDEQGNVLTLSKEKGKPVSYIWGYGNAYPIAEVANAPLQKVNETEIVPYSSGVVLDVTPNFSPSTSPFTTNAAQDFTYSVQVIAMGPGGFNGTVKVRLMNAAGVELSSGLYSNDTTFYGVFASLPSGTGSYYFAISMPDPGTDVKYLRVNIAFNYRRYKVHNNIFHASFEELTSGFQPDGKTGQKSIKGPFPVVMPWNMGEYILSWWQKPLGGDNWTYQEQTLNITTYLPDYVLGNNLLLLDEIRLYPRQAYMTTYTYRPQVGMTSKCDERNRLTVYEYDDLLRLKLIRDNNNNILKTFEYNYKN
jgi:hypothetical protein